MRTKFQEWTKIHADMYFEKLQKYENVLNIGSGYGFLEEEYNKRGDKKFIIEGDDIGRFRLDNYVDGICHDINFMTDEIPNEMKGKYDFILGLHILEDINEPVLFLSKLKPLLKAKGKLLFEVPNLRCFLCELSPEYREFLYIYEHVSYFTEKTLRMTIEKAGYNVDAIYTRELYSIENHLNWVKTGKPFTKYNQMFMPDSRMEFLMLNTSIK